MSKLLCPKCLDDNLVKHSLDAARADGTRPQRWSCTNPKCNDGKGYRTVNPLSEDDPRARAGRQDMRTTLGDKEIHVFTCAQNATDLAPVFETLKSYCKHRGAQLHVIPIRYHNPTSHWGMTAQAQDWWDVDDDLLFRARRKVHKHLYVLGDVSTQLTATRPTSGFETMTGPESAIIGHPKMELKMIPTPQQKLPKAVMTTGACTVPNYIPSKAGRKGEFHHTYGAIVVELDGDKFYFRQLNALNDGSFIDLTEKFYPDGRVEKTGRVPAIIFGDLHRKWVCPETLAATFAGKDSICGVLDPRRYIWHDMMDGYACNPHEVHDPFKKVARHIAGCDNILEEIQQCAEFLDEYAGGDVENLIVASNHEDFLLRWMRATDWREDPVNAEFYLETALEMLRHGKITEKGYSGIHPFPYWMKQMVMDAKVKYLGEDESYTVHQIEAGFHGHRGPNGARGTIGNYGKIGVKTIIGHSHTPGIQDGVFQTGTFSRLSMDYTSGPSSWLNTHGVIYENGKRVLLNVIDGDWKK